MIFTTLALATIVLIAICMYFHTFTRPKNFPPGPFPLPVIGNLHLLGSAPHKICKQLSRQYGDVFSLYFGGYKAVMINNVESANEALIKKAADFAGRPPIFSGYEVTRGGLDIAFSDYGPYWKVVRKTAHKALKMYGTNRKHLESVIHAATNDLLTRLEAKNGADFDPKKDFYLASANIICAVVFGSQYDIDDEEFLAIIQINKNLNQGAAVSNGVNFFPWLRFLPNKSIRLLRESVALRDPILEKWLRKHQESYEEGNIRDFTDALISASYEEIKEEKSSQRYLKEENILMVMVDVFSAGIDTTVTTMRWFIAYTVIWPETQKKIHEELDKVIGRSRVPEMSDRASLPYFEAALNETARLASVAPLTIHQTTCDTSVAGYDIPKKTHVFFNFYAMHHDERHWEDPEIFRPERWLDKDGQYTPGAHKSFLPFSAGKRVCLGEALAKMELFLILAQVYQHFEFMKAPDCESPSPEGLVFLLHESAPYQIIAKKRN